MSKKKKGANYDFSRQKCPEKNMGSGSFANLPDRVILANYGPPSYRGGIVNSFLTSISDTSGVRENGA